MLGCSMLLFLFLFSTFTISNSSNPAFITKNCSTTGSYSIPSSFWSNLNQLLSSLPQNAGKNGWFYNDTIGDAYGLAMCPNIDATDQEGCTNCLTQAATNIIQECPFRTAAALWYDGCFLRYSNQSFFSFTYIDTPYYSVHNGITASDVFKEALSGLMHNLIMDVEKSQNLLVQRDTNYSTSTGDTEYIYALVQCTRDLAPLLCEQRLNTYVDFIKSGYCQNSTGCRIFGFNGYLQYETHPFFKSTPQPPPPLPPPLSSPPPLPPQQSQINRPPIAAIVGIALACMIMLLLPCAWFWIRRQRTTSAGNNEDSKEQPLRLDTELISSDLKTPSDCSILPDARGAELVQFDLKTLQDATNNFSNENKLGEGGFGPVFKGRLQNGQEIAVKRLSGASKQGIPELENEVKTLGGLKHRNVVQLLGFCLKDTEKLLCYEYLPNRSLDIFLFENDSLRRDELDWTIRFKIIQGICRGLVYLHVGSGATIIHRDLKASNVLLDGNMNPKISDFGIAKLFDEDQTHKIATEIIGTMGYLAPEYCSNKVFSAKSDVFSFGVLILEIVTGRKCWPNLIGHVWKHWEKKEVLELKDALLPDTCLDQATKCIHIGLLCVQQSPKERPNISEVNNILNSRSLSMLSRPLGDPRD